MRAAYFSRHGDPGVITVGDLPTPEPGPDDVRVAVQACALNHLDLFVRRGIPGLELAMPHVAGAEFSGVVDAVGNRVDGWKPGERVIVNPSLWCGHCEDCIAGEHSQCATFGLLGEHVWGGCAEFVVAPARNLLRLPDAITFTDAASLPLTGQTAWRALFSRARLRTGETILILGASGGTAVAAVQLAKLAGAVVYAVSSGEENARKLRELGADAVIDRTRTDFAKEVWRLTDRRGVDVVLENVGEKTWKSSIRALKRGGRLVTYGATTGPVGETLLPLLFWKQITIMGSTMSNQREFHEAMDQFFRGRLRPVISHTLPLEELARAHTLLESGEQFGKIVLTVAR